MTGREAEKFRDERESLGRMGHALAQLRAALDVYAALLGAYLAAGVSHRELATVRELGVAQRHLQECIREVKSAAYARGKALGALARAGVDDVRQGRSRHGGW